MSRQCADAFISHVWSNEDWTMHAYILKYICVCPKWNWIVCCVIGWRAYIRAIFWRARTRLNTFALNEFSWMGLHAQYISLSLSLPFHLSFAALFCFVCLMNKPIESTLRKTIAITLIMCKWWWCCCCCGWLVVETWMWKFGSSVIVKYICVCASM